MAKNTKKTGNKPNTTPKQGKSASPSRKKSGSKVRIDFVGRTDVGKVRKNNEDNYIVEKIWDDKCVLAAAIDGLGGYEGGELAAKIAKDKIVEYLKESNNGERIELLKQAVTIANNAICDASQNDEKYSQMGCVLTVAIIDTESRLVNMAHVGDTRLYRFYDGVLKKLSKDHSLVGYREEIGDLTEEQAMNHPNRNIVDRVLGHERHLASDNDFIEAATFALESKTIFLFCSDGLTDMITSATITEILGRKCNLTEKQDALIQAALDAGGKDNVTVVLVEYISEEKKPVSQEDRNTVVQVREDDPEDVPNTPMPPEDIPQKSFRTKILYLFVGLLMGFLCGYGVGRHHSGQEIKVEDDGNIETIVIDSCGEPQPLTTDTLDLELTDTLIDNNNSELPN